jgi:ribosome maturation protein Sdo1
VTYRGNSDDFVVLAESPQVVDAYRKNQSKPLVDVLNSFDIFVTNKQGHQGVLDRASKSSIENEFGAYHARPNILICRIKDEVALARILTEGKVEETKMQPNFGKQSP